MPALSPMRARMVLVLASVLVAGLLAEALVRVVNRFVCRDYASAELWMPHPLYGWGHRAGVAGWTKRCLGSWPEWRTYVRINRRGLRERDIPYARGDAYRILVLGDSFTEAIQVDEEAGFTRQVEQRLNDARGGGRRVEVINAGVAGYGTDNALLFWRHEGRRYRPDLVLLAFDTENDVLENHEPLLRALALPYPDKPVFAFDGGRLVLRNHPMAIRGGTPEAIRNWLRCHSMAVRFLGTLSRPALARRAEAGPAPEAGGPLGVLLRARPPAWREAWRVTRALVRRLRREVEADGARFAVVVIGAAHEVSEARLRTRLALAAQPREPYDPDQAHRLITRFLDREGMAHIALLEAFRVHAAATGADGYFARDPHWNAAGHALAGELIARGLAERGLVPGS